MQLKGPWSSQEIEGFLATAIIPLRLAVVEPHGDPLVLSLWYMPREGDLWCATRRTAHVVKVLRSNPACAFEVAADLPPYRGVRGQGRATLHDDQGVAVLQSLMARYAVAPGGKLATFLNKGASDETAIRIRPGKIGTWDFTRRMTG